MAPVEEVHHIISGMRPEKRKKEKKKENNSNSILEGRAPVLLSV
jgi:hypothetical protein